MKEMNLINSTNNNLSNINYKSVEIKDSNEFNIEKKNYLIRYLKKFKNQIFNILSILCFTISVIFYVLSLKGCYLEERQCSIILKYEGLFKKFLIYMLLSTFLYCIYLFLCIHKIINRKHLIFNIVYIYLFIKYHKSNWEDHGFYNRLFFILVGMIFLFVFEYIKLIFVNFKKKKYKLFLILIIIPFFLFLYIRNYFKHPKCKGWEKGLLNTKLESKEDSLKANKCYIISPEECHIDAFEIINDYSKYVKKNCINKNNYKKNVEKFFTFDTKIKYKYIAYPSTKYLNYHEDGEEGFFHKKILSMITPVNSTEDDPNLEAFVEYDKKNRGKVIINLKKNNTLIEEREKLETSF